ncbi:hypothetical protein EI94DRAFT_1702762 [Lactarius quietus]|nr:hypothetical protein EI94DRAFT_1702762 [Lactarius quietus]
MGISLENAQFLSLGLTTFLYANIHWTGLFFMLFIVSTAVMSLRMGEDVRVHRNKILPVSSLMLVVATVHIVLLWIRGKNGFSDQKGGSATAFYENIADPTNVVKVGLLLLQSLLGDGVIIWRLYVVYDKRAWVIVPAIVLVLAYTAVGSVAFQFILHARLGTIFSSGNVVDYRARLHGESSTRENLWVVRNEDALARHFHHRREQRIICFWRHRSARVLPERVKRTVPAVDAIVPLVGIVFSLIVLQIRFHVSSSASHRSGDGQNSTNGGAWPRHPGRVSGLHDPEYPMRSIRMAVHVTKQTHTHLSTQDADTSSDHETEKATAL